MNIDLKDLAVHDNGLYIRNDNEFVQGWNKLAIENKEPQCHFKGGKMSIKVWFQILKFFKWTQETYKSESQVRLYYNTETKEWAAQPYPQSPSGMTTNDNQTTEIRSRFPQPWEYLGTAHHHCTSAAFQSNTDEDNEKNQDGWHYTIGHLDKPIVDYHGRFSWDSELYPAKLLSWIEMPKWFEAIPIEVRYRSVFDYLLCSSVADKKEFMFPEEWKSVIKPAPKPTYSYGGYQGGHYSRLNIQQEAKNTLLGDSLSFSNHIDTQKVEEELESIEEIESKQELIDEILWDAGVTINDYTDLFERKADYYGLHETWKSDVIQSCLDRGTTISEFNRMFEEIYYTTD